MGSGSMMVPPWTERHRQWLATVTLDWPVAQATLLDARGAIDALAHRREQLEREIVAMLPASPWVVQVGRLRCLRGVDTLSAVGLCAEIGDFERFARAEQLMSYVGLVRPSQRPGSSAGSARSQRQAPGTPAGCWSKPPGTTPLARVSAACSPTTSRTSPPEAIAVAWSAQDDCTAPGRGWRPAPSAARSSQSPPPANSWFAWAITQIE
jgi:hypothetical protein